MGKGSGRRPTEISEEQFQTNYDRTFRGPQVETPPACPETTEINGCKVRCSKRGEHLTHQVSFDGEDVIWSIDSRGEISRASFSEVANL